MYQLILFSLAFIFLIVGSITDIKKREVPDWVNYGLILIGLSLRGIFSIYLFNYLIFIEGLIGFGIMFLLACVMFYSGQWGGGDAKLLMALGAIFGISLNLEFQLIFLFLINLIIVGSFYGLIWTFIIFLKNLKKTKTELVNVMSTKTAQFVRVPLYSISVILLILAYFLVELRLFLILFSLLIPLFFYLWAYTKVVENVVMIKHVIPTKLTEGDWIAEEIFYKGKKIAGPKDLGISQKQINYLVQLYNKGKINNVLIKEGIPFVPSFLLAFLITLLSGNWILLLF